MAKRYYDSVSGSEMISSTNSGFANMPKEVVFKEYPKNDGFLKENLNDGMSGIDNQIKKDNSKKNSNLQPEKY